jgi:hypothetical protein
MQNDFEHLTIILLKSTRIHHNNYPKKQAICLENFQTQSHYTALGLHIQGKHIWQLFRQRYSSKPSHYTWPALKFEKLIWNKLCSYTTVKGKKLLPEITIENCHQKSLPKNIIENPYWKLLPKIITKNYYQKSISEIITKNYYQKPLPKTTTGFLLPETITENYYWKLLPVFYYRKLITDSWSACF